MAEIGHSKIQCVGRPNMSLLEAARDDVALAIRQQIDLQSFNEGSAAGGKGPTAGQRRARTFKAELKRAAAFGREVSNNVVHVGSRPPSYIPSSGKHRPEESSDQPARKRPKPVTARRHVSVAGGQHTLSGTMSKSQLVQHPHRITKVRTKIISLAVANEKPTTPPVATNCTENGQLHFTVVQLTLLPTVQIRYGCKSRFTQKYRSQPNDLILRTYCRRRYLDKEGVPKISSKTTAAYCHLRMDCVCKIQPSTRVSLILRQIET
jgi:hypothetical protein